MTFNIVFILITVGPNVLLVVVFHSIPTGVVKRAALPSDQGQPAKRPAPIVNPRIEWCAASGNAEGVFGEHPSPHASDEPSACPSYPTVAEPGQRIVIVERHHGQPGASDQHRPVEHFWHGAPNGRSFELYDRRRRRVHNLLRAAN